MDPDNPVVKLCVAGMQAEAAGNFDEAAAIFDRAWQARKDDFEACIAAHYVARHQKSPQDTLSWNREALERALACGDERVSGFYPSLYLNMGNSYEQLGQWEQASYYFKLAAEHADCLPDGRYTDMVREGALRGWKRLNR